MKYLELTQGKRAFVDDEDFPIASKVKWYYDHGYARHKGKDGSFYLHRYLLGLPKDKVDHKDGNGLNNCRENLRLCTQQQNMWNGSASRYSIYSKFKGVSWHKTLKYWTVSIRAEGKQIRKYAKSEKEAAQIYNGLALRYFGDFAKLNQI